jgi:formamidopyrimidine-DNA glycosylase
MPELPEVEVTRLGVDPHIAGQQLRELIFRREGLRWPFPHELAEKLRGRIVLKTGRRGKYLLIYFDIGVILIHLGMSGHLKIVPLNTPAQKHDHVDIQFQHAQLRMHDPRRFGALLWHDFANGPVELHPMLARLGIEPLEGGLTGRLLYQQTRGRSAPIKQILLAGEIVVGVGNIYASESLFHAKINPKIAAGRISEKRYELLAQAICKVLAQAIQQGGSTLKDFVGVNGQSGYFQQSYFVYDRAGQACRVCNETIIQIKQGQRSSFYCAKCQK